ncbi:RNI-like protein [Suhomyces tanzawaensis NRRL Y-17324]|uniref:RNI-like protein n=1 Tax=Suhomyces tanzawaensis NRRL Y-17324 TaxID=984487 RepID=A0A1E4SHA2_9ASCO|nr:RNI-like protein [Suhomyces tanzawaensis NRRL Y-17324]ODV78850.1 RNI-like protein [Suhomyces tanzawaensis NRRL Y-17324]
MNGPALSSSPTDLAANEYETGVTNGDVDWLFRGKSKKLTKKLNAQDSRLEKDPREEPPVSPSSSKVGSTGGAARAAATSAPAPGTTSAGAGGATSQPPKPSGSPKSAPIPVPKSPKDTSLGPKQPPTPQMTPPEKASKIDMFKFGRSRSSSASNASRPVLEGFNPLRRSSTNNIPPIGQIPEGEVVRSNSVSSQSSSPGVSRSNSKKSLFSSLSSKFKGSSSPQQQPTLLAAGLQKATANFLVNPEDYSDGPITPPSRSRAGSIKETPTRSRSGSKDSTGSRPRLPSRESNNSEHESISGKLFKRKASSLTNRIILNKNKTRRSCPLPELNNANIRRVTFAVDKLTYDPQQQIPSRRPRKGNVLIPEDLMAPPPRLSLGISLSDGGKVNQEPKYTERELNMAIEAQHRALLEAEKHAHEAHLSAKRIAAELQAKSKKARNEKDEREEEVEVEVEKRFNQQNSDSADIDSPLHVHENHFEDTTPTEEVVANEISLETVYTRCCHLREILPIPATLKQLKNKSKPLQVLKLLNPKPTLIDVLSFSDFIAITPINTVIFDNVTMSTEMLKHLLASLQYNPSLEKLSLRNVAIDEVGWIYLCKLLTTNLSIKKLDISQQRIKSDTKPNCVRSAMNWKLLINSLIYRGGIEELVINGCKLSDEIFEDLIDNAVLINTYRLGVASIELNMFKAHKVASWIINPHSKCVGVDIAFNDLSQGQLNPFINAFNKKDQNSKLIFFSLNSTNLTDVDQTSDMIQALSNIKTLRFLDLSSLPKLFPSIISKLSEHLPNFPNLKRIHFDLNELSVQAIRAIAEILPKIPGVMHVSLLGNRNLDDNSAGSLYTSIKLSKSIFTLDLDYDLVPDDLSQRIAFYLMRNMDNTMNEVSGNTSGVSGFHHATTGDDELMFDGSLLMETAEKLLIESDEHNKKEEVKIQKFITDALIERTRAVRKDIHRTIDDFFEKRNQGTLSLDGKETLLRFCLLDNSLEKLVHMFEERARRESLDSDEKSLNPKLNKKNMPTIKVPSHDQLHESSNELITSGPILSPHNTEKFTPGYFAGIEQTFQPHQVVIESSSDGRNVPIDNSTGRPVLMRSISHTSVHAKEQEQEEGEFHRLGFYIQQRNNSQNQLAPDSQALPLNKPKDVPMLNLLPSGSELRDAIIAAKGIESVTELIDKISTNRVSLDKLYTTLNEKQPLNDDSEGDDQSIDSFTDARDTSEGNDEVTAVVDEVYDKLLNDAQRVRLNKSG